MNGDGAINLIIKSGRFGLLTNTRKAAPRRAWVWVSLAMCSWR